jgi:hypothetical protein
VATFSLTSPTVFAGGYDLTTDLHQVSIASSTDELDDTTFGDTYRSRIGGLRDVEVAHEGYAQYANPDSTLFTDLATQRVLTITPTGADGATSYSCKATAFSYTPLDSSVGDVAGFSGSAMSSDGHGLVRGQLLLPKVSKSAIYNGTGSQLGAVSASQFLYTSIHVFTAGTTCTVIVESDDNSGFTSATTRSSTVVTAVGGTWVTRVAGSITDTWWRVRLASVTGTFVLAAAVGIQ